jgi:hypothetical protein
MKRITAAAFATLGAVALTAAPALAGPPPNTNSDSYWSTKTGLTCAKAEYGSDAPTFWTSDGYYALVLIKGGSVDTGYGPGIVAYPNVQPGQSLDSATNAGGEITAISWLMTCVGGSSSGS